MGEMLKEIISIMSDNELLRYLIDTSITASLMVLLFLIVRPFMKKLPRMGMYVLWLVLGLRLLCPVSVAGIYSLLPDGMEEKVSETRQEMTVEGMKANWDRASRQQLGGQENGYRLPEKSYTQTAGSDSSNNPAGESVSQSVNGGVSGQGKTAGQVAIGEPQALSMDRILTLVWGAGVCLLVLYLIVSLLGLRFSLSDAKQIEDNVYTHPMVSNSFVAGLLSPKIYMAENIPTEDREYILCHERIHIRRRDYLVKPLMFLVCSLYWFNPFMWLAYRLMEKDMEVSCDEAVIRRMGGEVKKRYSSLLIALTSARQKGLGQSTAFSIGVVKDRIRSVMRYRKPTAVTSLLLAVVILLFGCSVMSEPEATPIPKKDTSKSEVYVEQVIDEQTKIDGALAFFPEDNYYTEFLISAEGNLLLVGYPDVEEEKEQMSCPVVAEEVDGQWQKWELAGLEEYGKRVEGKPIETFDIQLDGQDNLYLSAGEYTEFYSEEEWEKDPEGYEKKRYLLHNYLFRVDRATGELTEIKLPEEKIAKVFPANAKVVSKNEVNYNQFTVCPDGNILLIPEGKSEIGGVYDWKTGEASTKIQSFAEMKNGAMCAAGDGFFVSAVIEYDPSEPTKVKLNVHNINTGETEYSLDTGLTWREVFAEGIIAKFALGVRENEIFIATGEGIFEAEYGETSFTKVVDSEKDNVYYLSENSTEFFGNMYKGEREDYYLSAEMAGGGRLLQYAPQSE
ncbi:MAG: M56 family metallopeptidase [Lachnospiraceae bacterium]|nr:M56 family metallopeptidase [Lachnospiraceae bacterium]